MAALPVPLPVADEGFTFGEFTFSNGGLTSTDDNDDNNNDDDWGDFFVAPPQPQPQPQPQSQSQSSLNLDPFPIQPHPKTPLPLSLSAQLQHNPDSISIDTNTQLHHSNGFLLPKFPTHFGINPLIRSPPALPSDFSDLDQGVDDWEFMAAFPPNGNVLVSQHNKEPGASVFPTSKVQPVAVMMTQEKEKQAGIVESMIGFI